MDSTAMWIIGGGVIVALTGLFVAFVSRYSKLAEELDALESRQQTLVGQSRVLQMTVATLEKEKAELLAKIENLSGHLETADDDVAHAHQELEKRVKRERKIYRILTVGMKATGKTSLTLKWATQVADLKTVQGTRRECYERTVSRVQGPETLTEHVFQIHDWGGEHIVDAQEQAITDDVNGILVVVDLGGRDARQVEQQRINEQLNEFNPQALRFFLTPRIIASCKTIVLFINKSDLIPGTPAQSEAQAKAHYAPLIENLRAYTSHIDVEVMVGSASYGHSTHLLFSHFIRRILPKSAYDEQSLPGLKEAAPPAQPQPPTPGSNGSQAAKSPPPQPSPPRAAPRTPGAPALHKATIPIVQIDANELDRTVPLGPNRLPDLMKKRSS